GVAELDDAAEAIAVACLRQAELVARVGQSFLRRRDGRLRRAHAEARRLDVDADLQAQHLLLRGEAVQRPRRLVDLPAREPALQDGPRELEPAEPVRRQAADLGAPLA